MTKLQRDIEGPVAAASDAARLGLWSSAAVTLIGVAYIAVLVGAALSARLTFPPGEGLQLFGAVSSLVLCPLLVVVFAAVGATTPFRRRVWAAVAASFCGLFALSVSINRFSQLGAVRRHVEAGETDALSWFLAYDDRSVMFGLELLGWGWFLGLAMIAVSGVFGAGRLDGALRRLCIAYGVVGLVSAILHLMGSPLSAVGFLAWGFLLFVITALLTVRFRRPAVAGV